MEEQILALARAMTGGEDAEEPLLAALCAGAAKRWRLRLRPGVTAEDSRDGNCCAAAYTAAADLAASRSGDGVESFTAGQVSVRAQTTGETTGAGRALRQTAEELMAPYTEAADFAFRGARG